MHTSNCIEAAAFHSVSTSFETPTILLKKKQSLSEGHWITLLQFQHPAKTSRLRQHQWCTSIHLRDQNWTNPAKLWEFSHSLNEVAYLKMFFEQSTVVKLGEVAIVTPLKWREPQVSNFGPQFYQGIPFIEGGRVYLLFSPILFILKKNMSFPVVEQPRWKTWCCQIGVCISYIYIYIDRLYEPNSNKNESYK